MKERLVGIDLLKITACLLVICIHIGPFKPIMDINPLYKYLAGFFDQIARVAVPFFFIASSYLSSHNPNLTKSINKLIRVFLFWSVIYVIFPSEYIFDVGYQEAIRLKLSEFNLSPLKLLFEGGRSHLWFLTSLVMAIFVFSKIKTSYGVVLGFSLYIVGCIFGSYSKIIFGYDIQNIINTRNGIFMSGVCWMLGQYVYSLHVSNYRLFHEIKKNALVIMFIGILGHFFEIILLNSFSDVSFIRHDFVISTIVFAFGFFLFGLNINQKINAYEKSPYITILSNLTLGVYLIHPMIIDFLNHFFVPIIGGLCLVLWQVLGVIVTFLLSTFVVLCISKNKYGRKFI